MRPRAKKRGLAARNTLTRPLLLYPMLVLAGIIMVYPFAHALFNSLVDVGAAGGVAAGGGSTGPAGWEWLGLNSYRYALRDSAVRYSLQITILWSLLNVTITLAVGFVLASRMVQKQRFRTILYALLLLPWAVPVYIAVPLWRALLHGNGGTSLAEWLFRVPIPLMEEPLAGFLSALLVSIWMNLPLTTFVLYGYIRNIDVHIIDAARIDGCSRSDIIRTIYMPIISPALVVLSLINGIGSFKEFTSIFLLTGGGPPLVQGITDNYIIGATTTLPVFLYRVFQDMSGYSETAAFGIIMSAAVLLLLILWRIARMPGPGGKSTGVQARQTDTSERLEGVKMLERLKVLEGFRRKLAGPGLSLSRAGAFRLFTGLLHLLPLARSPWWAAFSLLALYREHGDPARPDSNSVRHVSASADRRTSRFIYRLLLAAELFWAVRQAVSFGPLDGLHPAALCSLILVVQEIRRAVRDGWKIPAHGTADGTADGTRTKGRFTGSWSRRIAPHIFAGANHSIRWIAAAFLGLSALLLIYLVLWLSFSSADICTVTSFLPPFMGTDAYVSAFTNLSVGKNFLNSFIIAAGTALLTLLTVFPGSLRLMEHTKPSHDRWVITLQTVSIAGGLHTLIPLFYIFSPLGLLDTHISVILVYSAGGIPLALLLMLTHLHSLPASFRDNALLEGASGMQWLRLVMLPLSVPVLTTVGMIQFLRGWNGFLVPLLFLRSDALFPISLRLYSLAGDAGGAGAAWSLFAVISLMNMALLLIVFLKLRGPLGRTRA
ncbi:MAG: ABC transporter permease subunit [Spirochaetia bacterium]|nr:ABC transporter permease subunit [Spirochaetia bacterium]